MWIIPVCLVTVFVLWILAMNVDVRFFNGRFLVRAKVSKEEFKSTLERVLSQSDRPVMEWDPVPLDWITDRMNIEFQDPVIDGMREKIARSVQKDSALPKLSSDTVNLIRETLAKL